MTAAGLVLLFATTGASVLYQTNIVNTYETRSAADDWRADYERTYRHLEHVAQPSLVHMDVEVDLFPQDRRYQINGRYQLENQAPVPIETIWFSALRDVEVLHISVAGKPPTTIADRFRMYEFALETPLDPGETIELMYDLEVDRRPVSAGGADRDIVANGSFVMLGTHAPRFGYRTARELVDPIARRERGLPPSDRPTTVEASQAHGLMDERALSITFDITLSTSADQTAVAPGNLVSTWERDDRRFFRYSMDRPVTPFMAYVSARYATKRLRHDGIEIEIYYHPEHAANVAHFLEATTRSLDYFSMHLGPYPHDHLRIVEVPAGRPFTGMAAPGTTYFVETGGFLTDLSDPTRIDVVSKRVAHEVAHQWWGNVVRPANGPGATALVETTARYSELVVLNDRYGAAAVTAALGFELDRYLSGRTRQREVPLYQVENEPFLFYAKGALVMMALHDLIGEEAVATGSSSAPSAARRLCVKAKRRTSLWTKSYRSASIPSIRARQPASTG